MRKLTSIEENEIKKVFGDSYNWSKIRIRENSWMAKVGARSARKQHIGFVLFNTINFSRVLKHEEKPNDMAWLIHEVTHVLQYQEMGAQYILEALRAQRAAGYGYQGENGLKKVRTLESFNLEQQADIAKHYYQRLQENKEVAHYEPYVDAMKRGEF